MRNTFSGGTGITAFSDDAAGGVLDFDPQPLTQMMIGGIKTIRKMVEKEQKNRDRLIIRCLREKLKAAEQQRDQIKQLVPLLGARLAAPDLAASDKGALAVANGISMDSEQRKALVGAVRTVEKLVAEARMCEHITDGVTAQSGGSNRLAPPLANEQSDEQLPDFVQRPPEEILFPVSLIHARLDPVADAPLGGVGAP